MSAYDPNSPRALAYHARNRAIERLPARDKANMLRMVALLYPDAFDGAALAELAPPAAARAEQILIEMFREMGRP